MLVREFKHSQGERSVLLLDESGVPHFYANLYCTIHIRNTSQSVSTMKNILSAIRFGYQCFDKYNIDIEARFLNKNVLTVQEIESIAGDSGIPSAALTKVIHLSNTKEFGISSKSVTKVSTDTKYTRLTYIANFLEWLAGYLNAPSFETNKMVRALRVRRPKRKRNQSDSVNELNYKALSESQLTIAYNALKTSISNNVEKDNAVHIRNILIFKLLHKLGLRKGELLSLRVDGLNYDSIKGHSLKIRRYHDSKLDSRNKQPLVKTLERDLPLSNELAEEINQYVLAIRSKSKPSKKHPYLFVTHKKGMYWGAPLSIASVDLIFTQLNGLTGGNIHPHQLRHTFNYELSRLFDNAKEPFPEQQQEDMRSYLNGWKTGSGTAAVYNKRFIQEKAESALLSLQKSGKNL